MYTRMITGRRHLTDETFGVVMMAMMTMMGCSVWGGVKGEGVCIALGETRQTHLR